MQSLHQVWRHSINHKYPPLEPLETTVNHARWPDSIAVSEVLVLGGFLLSSLLVYLLDFLLDFSNDAEVPDAAFRSTTISLL
jgi:hypothetical protein